MFEGVITALVTPFRRRSARRRCTAPSRRRADRRGRRRAGSGRHDGRVAHADHAGAHPRHRGRDRGGREARPGHRRHRLELDARSDRAVGGGEARRRRRPAAGDAVLQPARPGAHVPALPGDHAGRVAADDRLQRAGAHRLRSVARDDRAPRRDARAGGRQGGDRIGAARVAGDRARRSQGSRCCRATTRPRSRCSRSAAAASSPWSATSRPR